jgi:hypothetical protein
MSPYSSPLLWRPRNGDAASIDAVRRDVVSSASCHERRGKHLAAESTTS